ncbi:hypothetical protein V2J09_011166 [Rumex salicifolius]
MISRCRVRTCKFSQQPCKGAKGLGGDGRTWPRGCPKDDRGSSGRRLQRRRRDEKLTEEVLELMTRQPAVIRTEATHVSLVDKNSLWRAIDAAIACVQKNSVERPAMSHVVTELKECLAMEMDACKSQGNHTF